MYVYICSKLLVPLTGVVGLLATGTQAWIEGKLEGLGMRVPLQETGWDPRVPQGREFLGSAKFCI